MYCQLALWKIAHELKEISFQQTALCRTEALSFPCRGSEHCSFHFLQLKTPKALNHTLKKQVVPSGFLCSLIRKCWLPGNRARSILGRRTLVPCSSPILKRKTGFPGPSSFQWGVALLETERRKMAEGLLLSGNFSLYFKPIFALIKMKEQGNSGALL